MTVSFMTKFETNMSKKISEEYGMKIFQMCSRSLKYILPHAHTNTHSMNHTGEVEVDLHSFLTSVMEMKALPEAPASLLAEKGPEVPIDKTG